MLERKTTIILEENIAQKLGTRSIKKRVESYQTIDQVLFGIAYDLDLDINFHIAGNYIIDYASAGHLAIAIDGNVALIAIPTSISIVQAQALEKTKEEVNDKSLFIYMLEQEKLNTLYVQNENITSNKNLINQALRMVQINKENKPKYKVKNNT